MDFLELLNRVARFARPLHRDMKPLADMAEKFSETDLDSLDMMMVMMYIAIIYGISDDDTKDFHPVSAEELLEFIKKHKTTEPESIDQAMESIK